MSAFAPTISSPEASLGFGEGAGTAPSTSPGFLKETFGSIKKSLGRMVGLQERDTKIQQEQLEKLEFLDDGEQGPVMPKAASGEEALEGVDTDDKTYSNFVAKAEGIGTGILDTIKEAFDKVSFGEKMMAIVLAGGFFIFSKYKDQLVKVLTPVVQFVMDIVDFLGPQGAFMAFLGGFILLKSGLATKAIKFAGQNILKIIKLSAASIDRQGGLFKAMGNGFEKINKGVSFGVKKLKNIGTLITGSLTKGFNALGSGFKKLSIGIKAMRVQMAAMLTPFLPAIAIAAAAVAVFVSLKSGFETFKQSLDDGDSMFTAVLKGLGDAMLTLVTLPYTLVQKLVGFIAGLFGFDNFKAELEQFDVKEAIVNTFKRLTGGMVMMIKAIAKGAAAALAAALPGGTTPQEAFAKAYAEVMAGGNTMTSSNLEGTSDFQGDQSSKDFNKDLDETSGYGNMGGDYLDIKDGVGTGNKFAVSYYQKQAEEQRYRDLGEGPLNAAGAQFIDLPEGYMSKTDRDRLEDQKYMDSLPESMSQSDKELYLEIKKRDMKNLDKAMAQAETIKNADGSLSKSASTSGTYVIKGGNVQGDTINQMSQTNVTGPLEVNNTEMTQKILQEHF